MKTNHLTEATKIMLMAASVIITCTLVWIGFTLSNTSSEISNSASQQLKELSNDINDSGIMKYDGILVEGSEVINCIRKNLGDYGSTQTAPIYVTVTTTVTNTYTNGQYLENIRSFADTKYIKPTATFKGKVVKNTNKVILGIVFAQQ